MFFGKSKLEVEIEKKDEQINTLLSAIKKNQEAFNRKLKNQTKEIKKLKKILEDKSIELEVLNHKFDRITNSDVLTEAYNKRYFYDVAESVISLTKREKKNLSVALISIDNYALIHNQCGTTLGNKVIQSIVHKIAYSLRESDVFVRLSDEEFSVLLPNTSLKQALLVSEKLRVAVESFIIVTDKNFTISLGVSEFINSKDNLDTVLSRAKTALIQTKEKGINSIGYI